MLNFFILRGLCIQYLRSLQIILSSLILSALFLVCVVILFIVISLFFLESLRSSRAPPPSFRESMSKINTNLAAHLNIFYVCGFSVHTESTNVGQKSQIVHKDWFVITNSQGDLFFLILSIRFMVGKFPYSPFLMVRIIYYLLFPFGILALCRALLSSSL